jgi:hypothetical protein
MTAVRQLLVAALAAATLAITAAPAAPEGPDLDGYAWLPIYGTGSSALSNGNIYAIKSVGADLFLGGDFTDFAGINAADRLVRWNGTALEWQAIGSVGEGDGAITDGAVRAIEVSGNNIYIGGDFTVTDYLNSPRQNLAWYTLPDPTFTGYWDYQWRGFDGSTHTDVVWNGVVNTITEIGGFLYVGGQFTDGADNPENDNLMLGYHSFCFTGAVSACGASAPDVTVCGGVTISCAITPPNLWQSPGNNGAGVGAVNGAVNSVTELQSGGAFVAGNFLDAGGNAGMSYVARYVPNGTPEWNAVSGVPSTMWTTASLGSGQYVAGWEGAYRYVNSTTWEEICPTALHQTGVTWTGIAAISDSLVFVASSSGLLQACNPNTGVAMAVPESTTSYRLANHRGDLIVTGDVNVGGLIDTGNYVARYTYTEPLPPTSRDSRGATDTAVLLFTLAALTALAGVQIRRRA